MNDSAAAAADRVLVRLRPIAQVTPTATGLHARGWRSGFTVRGGRGLWAIWQRLAGPLADGVPPARLAAPDDAPPVVAKALELIIGQLREHDLLVEVPAAWAAAPGDTGGPDPGPPPHVASWLESVAPVPLRAWRRMRSTPVAVVGGGAPAAAARRTLLATGLEPELRPGDGPLLLLAGGHAVAAGCAADVGFVVRPGPAADVLADAAAVAARLGGEPGPPPEVLAALVGSAAAHRLVCAVGGLPDPSTEAVNLWHDSPPPDPPHQPVLVARLDPLRAEYHPWLSAVRPGEPDGTLVRVLGDPELGPVPAPGPGSLPQSPVALAASGDVVGFGTTDRAARLDAVIRAARRLAPDGAVLGADRRHADGLALRTAARRLAGTPVAEDEWLTDPTARRWWKAVVLRFALPAAVEVTRLAERVVRARVHAGGHELSWAVEVSAADAVAFAAMAAAGRAQAGLSDTVVLSGAMPVHVPDGVDASRPDRDRHWPLGVRDAEEGLQDDLRRLLGVAEVEPVGLGPVLDAAGVVGRAVPEVGR
ncbi:hypothetical protein IOD16_18910 [Saccharothrix sp. 6-C]|uniref:hypothetical protein n=1 Tax=Saccharothrix sp. 6-C TaxID=2781735 RepID=UPI0019172DBE|nr:hypothetical protein [Saccharothrix sp. 6-C]QQQ73383.1 hypothetical protein IOD16_18910 [Saccharothrix sp. 6-C]